MSSHPELRLDWCSYEAATYAVKHWHYSGTMPAYKTVKLGVWEGGEFCGAIIYSHGSNKQIGQPFGLPMLEVCELTRIALRNHQAPVSRMIRVSFNLLRQRCPNLRLLISYADPWEHHVGAIYQASNWRYLGLSSRDNGRNHRYESPTGKVIHWRSMSAICGRYGVPHNEKAANDLGYKSLPFVAKHKYAYPLDDEMRRRLSPLAQPYPKRAGSIGSDASAIHAEEGGASPTPALQLASAAPIGAD